ncbi:uncharacterized protein LOC133299520 [Gastrolobium bilobum]|uniref:uncharacterized protein LOC133299520 n=1 Tax=Gastrolobium bilobum TaxID=150636 RepID=UPI002AB28950|nr:uncharacterized protein LOC133299520 [Gastrolobium bilobum]
MAISGKTRGLASTIVIIVLILPEIAAQTVSPATNNVSKHVTQKDNTIRFDPLNNFKKYRGGFDISNKHYWSSVVFTGVYGYAIGVLWLLSGLLAASGLVLAGSAKFHSHAKTSVNIIIKTANDASETIYNATGAIKKIQADLMDSGVGVEASGNLDSITEKFNAAADNIVKEARKNRRIINKAFEVLFDITIVIISLNMLGVTILSGMILIKCWNFLSNSLWTNEVSEGNLLSCYNVLVDDSDVLATIWSLFLRRKVNSNISNLQGKLIPNLVPVCNPFSAPPESLYQPENCPPNTIQIGDIPEVLKPYTCFYDTGENCGNEDFLTGSEYKVVEAYTSSIQNLLNVYPGVEKLLGCQLVKDALSQVLFKHCKPLKKFARTTWVGVVILAVIMVFLVVLWTIKAPREDDQNIF